MGRYRPVSSDDISAIVSLHKAGHSVSDIAENTGISVTSVRRWVSRISNSGGENLPRKKVPTGRPRKTYSRTLNIIKRDVEKVPSISARQLKENNSALLGQVSLRTVQRRVHDDLRFKHFVARPKPLLTDVHKEKRLQFCNKYLATDVEKWKGVLWSDEAKFTVTSSRKQRVYRRLGSDPYDPKFTHNSAKYPDSLMVWGCFSYCGAGKLVVLPKNTSMNQNNYLELLCDNLPECFEVCRAHTFMQDNAPCHRAKSVTTWLQDCCVDFIEDWPANSPDLNPIENLWSIIKRKLCDHNTSTLPRLEAVLQQLWAEISLSTLQSLVESVPLRLQECIRRKGMPTKY